MITPYICAVCEKVIVAKDDVASLIGLFNRIILTPLQEIPKEAVIPKEWAVFGIWDSDEDLANREVFACMKVLYPDQTQYGQITRQKLVMSVNRLINRLQTFFQANAFPIGQNGPYEVHTWLEDASQIEISETKKIIIHVELARTK